MSSCDNLEPPKLHYCCQNGRHDKIGAVFVLTGLALLSLVFIFFGDVNSAVAAFEENSDEQNLLVGEITIQSDDIFSEKEIEQANTILKIMQTGMNNLHITTRENVLRRELLFQTGEPFDAELLSETERNLRTLGFLNNIFVVATDTTDDGRVNVTVRSRESWTLQAAANYSRASNGDQRWNTSLSETNFLGLGTTLGGGVGATEISSYWNLWYRHRRIFGSSLFLGVDFSEVEGGHVKKIFLSRPFFAQAGSWSFYTAAWDNEFDVRHYLSNAGPAGLDPTSPANLNALLLQREKGFEGRFLVRAKGLKQGRIWRLGGGLQLVDSHTAVDSEGNLLSDGRVANLDYLLEEGEPLEMVQGLTVFPYIWLQTIGRQWTKESFVLRYGFVEDIPLGFVLDLKSGIKRMSVGSTNGSNSQFYNKLKVSRWKRLFAGMALVSGQLEYASGPEKYSSHKISLLGGWLGKAGSDYSPWLTRIFAEVAHGDNLVSNEVFALGLERGLRSLDFDGMAGNRLVRWNFEQGKVTTLEPGGLFRLGGALFYNGGIAMFDDESRSLGDARHEVGLGLRLGPTRSANARVSRLDVSWALDGSRGAVFTATTGGTF